MILMILGDHASAFIPFFFGVRMFDDLSLVQLTIPPLSSVPTPLRPPPLPPSLIFHYMMQHRHMLTSMNSKKNRKKLHMIHCIAYKMITGFQIRRYDSNTHFILVVCGMYVFNTGIKYAQQRASCIV